MNRLNKELITVGSEKIAKGERKIIQLEVGSLYDYTPLSIPVEIIRGKDDGPSLFISAAIHGDEINGVEAIGRISKRSALKKIKGTLFLIPIVNVFGFNNKSRYLPDRRDLNRCFPGSKSGPLGNRLAHVFLKEIVSKCTHGIDLHTGAIHRSNLPQIRACIDNEETKALAESFGVPVIIHSQTKDGSLREAARKKGVRTLLYEGGEALRFEEDAIRSAERGCLSTMRSIGMLPKLKNSKNKSRPHIGKSSYWVRAPHGGSFRAMKKLGDKVAKGDVLAIISDPFGEQRHEAVVQHEGIIIGCSMIPLVNRGDAMFHIASFDNLSKTKQALDDFDETFSG